MVRYCIKCKCELDHNVLHVLYRENGKDIIGARCKSCQRQLWMAIWGNTGFITKVMEIGE
jgi:hypothetical protein